MYVLQVNILEDCFFRLTNNSEKKSPKECGISQNT